MTTPGMSPRFFCPFDVIVITSPDPSAAEAAPLKDLASAISEFDKDHNSVQLVSTCDPFGARCGSGGGTLAALDLTESTDTVLIVHAGGDSSRCPTQMSLGKAWTTLPLMVQDDNNERGQVKVMRSNPTALLIRTLGRMCQSIPKGSIVVVASDCILYLPVGSDKDAVVDWTVYHQSVIGLGVPAPLSTAKNHGVFVLDPGGDVRQVLQKPSPAEMQDIPHCVVMNDQAWIDTGVVIFLPAPALALRKLASDSSLMACTERGLRSMWEERTSSDDASTLEQFACANAIKVELYTHFLRALALKSTRCTLDEYVGSFPKVRSDVLNEIFEALNVFSLDLLTLPTGRFIHLGTSRELVDFMVYGSCRGRLPEAQNINHKSCREFGTKLRLSKFVGSLVDPQCVSSESVIVNTVLQCDNAGVSIGPGSVVEHSFLVCNSQIQIGKDCLMSGVRGSCDSLSLTDGICLQMLPLQWNERNAFVYMCFGLNDDIKTQESTLYGMNVKDVLRWTGLEKRDLWDTEVIGSLWKARIHPIVLVNLENADTNQYNALFGWIGALKKLSPGSDAILPCRFATSLALWKSVPRLSLSEIRQHVNAHVEFQFRSSLEKKVVPSFREANLQSFNATLLQRQHDETHLTLGVLDIAATGSLLACRSTLSAIDQVLLEAMREGDYDICGRAFMLESVYLERLAKAMEHHDTEECPMKDLFDDELASLDARSSSSEDRKEALARLAQVRDLALIQSASPTSLKRCSEAMEKAAATMTEMCVSNLSTKLPNTFPIRAPAAPNTWVLATAPARIDLAGAWTDTPPICYEFGGAVLNVAVTVDGKKPLSCRCRMVTGERGVTLRAEARDSMTGELRSQTSTTLSTLGDLQDCRDPATNCALFKCALVYCGLVPICRIHEFPNSDLQPYINRLCQTDSAVGLELVSTSLLPQGSGMGTSSILAGCMLGSISQCCGLDITHQDPNLIHAVLRIEQLLTTGGGWQDQVGGLMGGFKLARSVANVLPLFVSVEQVPLDPSVQEELNGRLLLAFTGKTRLAKNILQKVLRRWAQRSPEIVKTVGELVSAAPVARDAVLNGSIDQIASSLNDFWASKKAMAGPESGVEPDVVRDLIHELHSTSNIAAASMCGAGGGGFMVLLTSAGRSPSHVKTSCEEFVKNHDDSSDFSWHDCSVCNEGMTITTFERDDCTLDSFHMGWHDAHPGV